MIYFLSDDPFQMHKLVLFVLWYGWIVYFIYGQLVCNGICDAIWFVYIGLFVAANAVWPLQTATHSNGNYQKKKCNKLPCKITTAQSEWVRARTRSQHKHQLNFQNDGKEAKKKYTHAIICFKFTENTYKCRSFAWCVVVFIFVRVVWLRCAQRAICTCIPV